MGASSHGFLFTRFWKEFTMLQVSNIGKRYGDTVVLENVSFIVNPGDRLGLIGPNGCGKTTLLRIISGEEDADAGSVQLSPPDLRPFFNRA